MTIENMVRQSCHLAGFPADKDSVRRMVDQIKSMGKYTDDIPDEKAVPMINQAAEIFRAKRISQTIQN